MDTLVGKQENMADLLRRWNNSSFLNVLGYSSEKSYIPKYIQDILLKYIQKQILHWLTGANKLKEMKGF